MMKPIRNFLTGLLVGLAIITAGAQIGIVNAPPRIAYVAATPEGALAKPVGWLAVNTTNGSVYSKTSGVGNTGWTELAAGAGIIAADIDTSAELDAILTDDTGSGAAVFATSPTLVTPVLGVAAATTLDTGQGANELFDMDQNVLQASNVQFAQLVLTSTLTLPDNVRVTFNPGANAAGMNVGCQSAAPDTPANGDFYCDSDDGAVYARVAAAWVSIAAAAGVAVEDIDTSAEVAGIVGDESGTGALVFANTPTLVTPVLGAATGTSLALGADPADAEAIRLVNAACVAWEAAPAGTDITLCVNASEQFVFSAEILSPTLVTPVLGVASATSVTVSGEAYDEAGWNADNTVPTKNDIRDYIENNISSFTDPDADAVICWDDVGNNMEACAFAAGIHTWLLTSTSANLAAAVTNETGSGLLVFGTSPTITTSIVAGGATFALLNTTATTVNAFGEATAINIGAAAAAIVNLGGFTSAAELRFLEPSGSGSNYSGFKAVAQGASITYTLPPALGAAGSALTDVAGDGVLTWVVSAGAGDITAVGDCASGACSTIGGLTLTAPRFADLGFIADANGNEQIILDTIAAAVNELSIRNAATGGNPRIAATGGDSDVGIDFLIKGAGVYNFLASASGPADIRLYEDSDNGTNYISLIGQATLAGNIVLTLPGTTDTLIGKATVDILTNKTFNTADNVFIDRVLYEWSAAQSNATVGSVGGNTPSSNPCVATDSGQQTAPFATCDFDQAADEFLHFNFGLPAWFDATGQVDVIVYWYSTANANEARLCSNTTAKAASAPVAGSFTFDDETCSEITTDGTANDLNISTISNVDISDWAASALAFVQFSRDANHANDDLAADAKIIKIQVIYRVSK